MKVAPAPASSRVLTYVNTARVREVHGDDDATEVTTMSDDRLLEFLLWGAAINYAVLLLWAGMFLLAHDWTFRLHSRWFALSREAFDLLNYGGIGLYKLGNILFFLVPALALVLSGGS